LNDCLSTTRAIIGKRRLLKKKFCRIVTHLSEVADILSVFTAINIVAILNSVRWSAGSKAIFPMAECTERFMIIINAVFEDWRL